MILQRHIDLLLERVNELGRVDRALLAGSVPEISSTTPDRSAHALGVHRVHIAVEAVGAIAL